jgi:hypothetical protein
MNSPVACLLDPIQNMTKRRNTLRKTNKKQRRQVARRLPPAVVSANGRNSMSAPAAYGATMGSKRVLPLQAGAGNKLLIQNFELVHAANGSNGIFSTGGDVCNPGIATSYPWLSGVAKQYTKFKWHFLRYIYVPTCSTATAGSTYFMFSYDYYDAGPSSLAGVAQSENSSIGNAWFGGAISPENAFGPLSTRESIYTEYDPSKSPNDWYYVRTSFSGATPSSGGALGGVIPGGLTFVAGTMPDPEARPATIYYGADGVAGTASIGNLFAAYICELSEPIASTLNA